MFAQRSSTQLLIMVLWRVIGSNHPITGVHGHGRHAASQEWDQGQYQFVVKKCHCLLKSLNLCSRTYLRSPHSEFVRPSLGQSCFRLEGNKMCLNVKEPTNFTKVSHWYFSYQSTTAYNEYTARIKKMVYFSEKSKDHFHLQYPPPAAQALW